MKGDRPFTQGNIETTGRLITAVDPTQLGRGDFQLLSNMRYIPRGIRSIKGMTRFNSGAIAKPYVKSMWQFINPFGETHLLAQGFGTPTDNSPVLYDIDVNGNVTSLFSESAGAGVGTFSEVPDGAFIYMNGIDMLMWGGKEARCSGFTVADKDGVSAQPTMIWDYLQEITQQGQAKYASVKQRYIHIASTRKLQGVKFYVKTANTAAVSVAVQYWNGSAWTAVSSPVDGTAVGGKTLAQTGEISFASTVGTAAPKYFNNTVLYWYLFDFNGADATTAIYHATVDAPIQTPTDIWDGLPVGITSFQVWDKKQWVDHAAQVFQQDYVSGSPTTYYNLNAFVKDTTTYSAGVNAPSSTSEAFAVGFASRMCGLRFHLAPTTDGKALIDNTVASTMTVRYWNGSAWTSVGTILDDTSNNGATLNRSGQVTWQPPSAASEFQNAVTTEDMFYYYLVSFSANLSSGGIYLDWIEGIPYPDALDTYGVSATFQGRVCLCNDTGDKNNSLLMSAQNTNCTFNGKDSTELYFGDNDEIVAAIPFFSRFSNSFFENLLALKTGSVWVVDGTVVDTPQNGGYAVMKVSSMYGCSAPQTVLTCDVGIQGGASAAARQAVIWQSATAIILWDGSTLMPISSDIKDVFDQTKSYAIEPTMISQSSAFFDEANMEYHWLWASKGENYLNMESVFDLVQKKWYTVNRGTNNNLQSGCIYQDANNNFFSFGGSYSGYVEQLETGQTLDGTAITSTWQTGDMPLGGWTMETELRKVSPIFAAKNNTGNKLTVYFYGDSSTTPYATLTFGVANASSRLANPQTQSLPPNSCVFHSCKWVMTTSNEDYCLEPIAAGIFFRAAREHLL